MRPNLEMGPLRMEPSEDEVPLHWGGPRPGLVSLYERGHLDTHTHTHTDGHVTTEAQTT